MSALLERAKAHYASLPRREIAIPEWGETPDKPALVTWTDLTLADQGRIYAADDEGRSPSGSTVRLRALIFKACDAEGRRLFDGMAEHDLRHNVAGDIVGRIANAILYGVGLVGADGNAKGVGEQIDDAKNG